MFSPTVSRWDFFLAGSGAKTFQNNKQHTLINPPNHLPKFPVMTEAEMHDARSKIRSLIHHSLISGVGLSAVALQTLPAYAEPVELILRNGDSLKGTLVRDDSTDEVTVLIHPNLGRIEIKTSALKPKTTRRWSGSLAAGVNGNNTDQDLRAGGTLTLSAQYKQHNDTVNFKGQAQYELTRDAGESISTTDTNQGQVELRFSRRLNKHLNAYASSRYTYDTLNAVGTDTFNASAGLGVDLIKTSTTVVNVSLGPGVQSIWGGNGCISDATCGRTYAASTARVQMDWSPNQNIQFNLTDSLTAAFSNGVKPINTLSATLKIFPTPNKSLFTALTAQTIFDSLQSPQINNSVSFQIGAELK